MINRIYAARYQKALAIVGQLQDWIDQRYNPTNNSTRYDIPFVMLQFGRGAAFIQITVNEISMYHSEVDDEADLDFTRCCNIWIKHVQLLNAGISSL